MAKKNNDPRSLHFIGINGVAMSGLAIMASKLGYEVRGSDVDEVFPTDEILQKNQIKVLKGFSVENLKPKPDAVIISAAYGLSNPEVKALKSLRINVKTQSEMLGELMQSYEGVGVSGVHGKTTTSSMLAYIFKEGGFSPSYSIGAPDVPGLDGNAILGDGKYFVVEADEYRKAESSTEPKFLDLPLKHIIITSIELDHPDVFATAEDVYQAFYRLSTKIPRDGTIVACVDSPLVRRLVQRRVDRNCLTYGFSTGTDYQIIDVKLTATATEFKIKSDSEILGPIQIQLPGNYNVLNATAAFIMARQLGVNDRVCRETLSRFQGPRRRFEKMGEYNGAPIYQDYAHHPTAVTYLLEGVRAKYPDKRVVLVFQPHTYSRTGKLLKEFAESLVKADKLILLNIFASAREKSGYVTIKDLMVEVEKRKNDAEYRGSLSDAAQYLKGLVKPGDIVLLVGAGDVYKIYDELTA